MKSRKVQPLALKPCIGTGISRSVVNFLRAMDLIHRQRTDTL